MTGWFLGIMKRHLVLLLAVLASCPYGAYAAPDKTLLAAREAIISPSISPQDALLKYSGSSGFAVHDLGLF